MKILYSIILAVLTISISLAQDVIIKRDRTEIQAKVEEITDTHIRYIKWNNLEGPVYNVRRTDVFMIIYSNGQREMIEEIPEIQKPETSAPGMEKNTGKSSSRTGDLPAPADSVQIDDETALRKQKVNYNPQRLNIGLQKPLQGGVDTEVRVVRNFFNIGVSYDIMPSTYNYFEKRYEKSSYVGGYGSIYAPVNRIAGKFQKQDKGVFVFGHAGYIYSWTRFGSDIIASGGGFYWRLGADYFFVDKLGISLSTYEFRTFSAGIAVKIF